MKDTLTALRGRFLTASLCCAAVFSLALAGCDRGNEKKPQTVASKEADEKASGGDPDEKAPAETKSDAKADKQPDGEVKANAKGKEAEKAKEEDGKAKGNDADAEGEGQPKTDAGTKDKGKAKADEGAKAGESGKAKPAAEAEWTDLFDGKSLEGWKQAGFGGEGTAAVEDGNLVLPAGATLTGIVYTGETPKIDYEVELEAQRVEGTDFFVGLTFPYGDTHATFIVGGWGGGLNGISSVDGFDAANNSYAKYKGWKKGEWYKVRLRATQKKIEAWVGDEQFLNIDTEGKKISTRPDIDRCKPFGLATYQTKAAIRNIRIRPVQGDAEEQPEDDNM